MQDYLSLEEKKKKKRLFRPLTWFLNIISLLPLTPELNDTMFIYET